MTRRLQLLDPESRSSGSSVYTVVGRVRDGLLQDNKVVPAVLGILALLIFAWLVAGTLIDGIGGEEEKQASNQASLAPGVDSDSGDTETPAPGVDNRDSDASYGGYDEGPKDPFRQILSKAGEEDANADQGGDPGGGNGGGRNGGSPGGGGNSQGGDRGSNSGDRNGGSGDDSEDFIEQRSPGDPDFQGAPGGGTGQGGAGQSGAGQTGAGQGGGLFNSGGDLPAP